MSRVQNTTQEESLASAQRVRTDWKTLVDKVSYQAIVNNVPYLAFVSLLLILYINNGQQAIEMQGELNKQNKVLKELRWKYMDIKTQLLNTHMEMEVIRNASSIGLKPLMLPAYSVVADKDSINR